MFKFRPLCKITVQSLVHKSTGETALRLGFPSKTAKELNQRFGDIFHFVPTEFPGALPVETGIKDAQSRGKLLDKTTSDKEYNVTQTKELSIEEKNVLRFLDKLLPEKTHLFLNSETAAIPNKIKSDLLKAIQTEQPTLAKMCLERGGVSKDDINALLKPPQENTHKHTAGK